MTGYTLYQQASGFWVVGALRVYGGTYPTRGEAEAVMRLRNYQVAEALGVLDEKIAGDMTHREYYNTEYQRSGRTRNTLL